MANHRHYGRNKPCMRPPRLRMRKASWKGSGPKRPFTEKTTRAKHQEVYSLFSTRCDGSYNNWLLNPWYCCSVLSEQAQAPLHKEATHGYLKELLPKVVLWLQ